MCSILLSPVNLLLSFYIPFNPSILEAYRKITFILAKPQCFAFWTKNNELPKEHKLQIIPSMFRGLQAEISEYRKIYSIFRKNGIQNIMQTLNFSDFA